MAAGIEIDLDSTGFNEREITNGGGPVESSIRLEALQQVMMKLVEKPHTPSERDDPFRTRPLALDVMTHRSHDAILVSARRGDGKTTFLTDILRLLQEGREVYRMVLPDASRINDVAVLYPLGIVDPTLIETKQNIVVIVIEKIETAVKRAYRLNESTKKGAYEDFRRVLHELAAGLTLLDGIGDSALHGKDWADADYILERGLEKARSAGSFERAFHRYLKAACTFLSVDAFVLAIDDVDTSFDRGWPVMEALRKYFATPFLKVIMAGDLRLYNLLVRQQQWKQISKEFFEIESKVGEANSYSDQLADMVGRLQDQYLVKIVRPENRVKLAPLLFHSDRQNLSFRASRSSRELSLSEKQFLPRYARHLLGIDAVEDLALVRGALLRLPLRSVLQALAGAWDLCSEESSGERSMESRRRALDALTNVASAGLMTLDLAEHDLEDPDPRRVLASLSKWLTAKNLWSTTSRFHPNGTSEVADLVSMCVAAHLTRLFRENARAAIDYWLRICTIREKVDRGELVAPGSSQSGEQGRGRTESNVTALIHHLKVDAAERSTQFVSRLATWDAARGRQVDRGIRLSGAVVPGASRLREANAVAFDLYGIRGSAFKRGVFQHAVESGSDEDRGRLLGALSPPLRGFHQALINAGWSYTSKRGLEAGFIGTFANTLESLRSGLDADARAAAMMPALRLVSGQGAGNGVYSVMRLIAAIAELIGAERTGDPDADMNRLRGVIGSVAGLRSYPTPGALFEDDQDEADGDAESSEDDAGEREQDEDLREVSAIAAMLSGWLDKFSTDKELATVAPITLARSWTRFTYAFDEIGAGLVHTRTRYLGVLMHRAIIAFLHAVGVEALLAVNRSPGSKAIDNPIKSGLPFLQLLKAIDDADDLSGNPNIKFFKMIFRCPLWGYFFARQEIDISGKTDRENATEEIFKRYKAATNEQIGEPPQYTVKFTRDGKTAEFDGLYFLLNSVQLQGKGRTKKDVAGTGAELAKVLDKIEKALATQSSMPEDSIQSTATGKTPVKPAR